MNLFTPFPSLNLKNRTVMAPMTRYNCTEDGCPTKDLIDYYVKRAKNEVGLIIVESSAINNSDAKGYLNGAQFHSEKHVSAWKPVIDQIHEAGAKVWIQLFHAGRLTVKEITGTEPVAPSPVKTFDGKSYWRPEKDGEILHFQTQTPYKTPVELTVPEIETIIQQFANSCRLAEKAGFDGVELHGAHGYLLHQFCHSETNQRTDKYNQKDFQFVKELIQVCRAGTSKKFVLAYRLSLHMVDSSYLRYSKENLDYGNLVEVLDKEGVDVFHSSELKIGSKMFGGKEALHHLIRNHTEKTVIACGSIKNAKKANNILEAGKVDLIAIGRALISNPELVLNFANGEDEQFEKFDYAKHIDTII